MAEGIPGIICAHGERQNSLLDFFRWVHDHNRMLLRLRMMSCKLG